MTDEQQTISMPAKPAMVHETVKRFDAAGLRSQLLELDTVTLEALGLMLVDRESNVHQAYKWLNAELGGTDEEPLVDHKAVYRFAAHFRRLYEQVRREHARRIARLRVQDATQGNVDQMATVLQHGLVEHLAEKIVSTDDVGDLSGRELGAMVSTLDGLTKAKHKEQELRLKAAEAERKAEQAAAELRIKQQRIEDRVRSLQKRIDDLSTRTQKGESIDPAVFSQIREELAGLAEQPEQEAA